MKKFLALFLSLAYVCCPWRALPWQTQLPTITIMFHGSNVTDDTGGAGEGQRVHRR